MPVKTLDTAIREVRRLYRVKGMSLRQIQQIQQYSPIPPSTIKYMIDTGRIPKKWHKQLNVGVVDVTIPLSERRKQLPQWVTVAADWLESRQV